MENEIKKSLKNYMFSYTDIEPVVERLSKLMLSDTPVIISIDGRCGSGKTSMAGALSEVFSCNIIHMDGYYLPFDKRGEAWEKTIAGNMDIERLLNEALLPAGRGEGIIYRAFNAHLERFEKEEKLLPHKLTVVEGSYSQHPLLADKYDLKIFLTCSKEVQARRLRKREGENYAAFEKRWIPMEENYLTSYDIEIKSDLVIDTSRL